MEEGIGAQKGQGTQPGSCSQVASPPQPPPQSEPTSVHSSICEGTLRTPGGSKPLPAIMSRTCVLGVRKTTLGCEVHWKDSQNAEKLLPFATGEGCTSKVGKDKVSPPMEW